MKKIKFVTQKDNRNHSILITTITILLCLFIVVVSRIYAGNQKRLIETADSSTQDVQNMKTSETALNDDIKENSPSEIKKEIENQAKQYESENDINIEKEKIENSEEKFAFENPLQKYGADIQKVFSRNELLYSNTMGDWRIHNGIDVACPMGSEVRCAERGKVVETAYDQFAGYTITVEHIDGFKTVYSNLSSIDMVKRDAEVKKGEIIATTGDSAVCEVLDAPHLHFEILKDGKYVNPVDYME